MSRCCVFTATLTVTSSLIESMIYLISENNGRMPIWTDLAIIQQVPCPTTAQQNLVFRISSCKAVMTTSRTGLQMILMHAIPTQADRSSTVTAVRTSTRTGGQTTTEIGYTETDSNKIGSNPKTAMEMGLAITMASIVVMQCSVCPVRQKPAQVINSLTILVNTRILMMMDLETTKPTH